MIDISTHPWMSGLFGDPEIAAIFDPQAELQRFLKIEAAWSRALGAFSDQKHAEKVARLIETAVIAPESLKDGFAVDGVPIPALVKLLKADIESASHPLVHAGLTSQDVMDTSLVLALSEVLNVVSERVVLLDQQLEALKLKFGAARLMAFTRMQPALETTVAVAVDRWRQPLPRLQSDLARAAQDIAVLQWGGPIGTRDHPNAETLGPAFAANLGLSDSGLSWHTDRSRITQVVNVLMGVTVATGKIGEDIALMAAIGAEQITMTGGSSSAMAHKNNPVLAETLISLANYAGSLQLSLTQAARHEGFRSGQAWTLEWLALSQLCIVTGAGMRQAQELLASVETLGRV
ncbi:lyase family protein [Planktotalea sp.]|uniref:lyase family protein n=1 Tax=Planktotalea sp. TaxID=2029877 RepID=UPI003298E0CD